jgi:hypothetical protein
LICKKWNLVNFTTKCKNIVKNHKWNNSNDFQSIIFLSRFAERFCYFHLQLIAIIHPLTGIELSHLKFQDMKIQYIFEDLVWWLVEIPLREIQQIGIAIPSLCYLSIVVVYLCELLQIKFWLDHSSDPIENQRFSFCWFSTQNAPILHDIQSRMNAEIYFFTVCSNFNRILDVVTRTNFLSSVTKWNSERIIQRDSCL